MFINRRIISNCKFNTKKQIQHLVNKHFYKAQNGETQVGLLVFNIVMQLINHGIKNYMKTWHNEKTDNKIVEMIFNKIIISQFEVEYYKLLSFNSSNSNNKFQHKLFNTQSIMCYIMKFLSQKWSIENDNDLYNCRLVNSYFLFLTTNRYVFSILLFYFHVLNKIADGFFVL